MNLMAKIMLSLAAQCADRDYWLDRAAFYMVNGDGVVFNG